MSVLDLINIHPTNLNSAGRGGVRTLTKEDVLGAIPDDAYGNILISIVMQSHPNIKSRQRIKSECIILYKRLKRKNVVKQLPEIDLNRIVDLAIKSINAKPISTRKFADKICEAHRTSTRKHYPVYIQFLNMIESGLQNATHKTIRNLK